MSLDVKTMISGIPAYSAVSLSVIILNISFLTNNFPHKLLDGFLRPRPGPAALGVSVYCPAERRDSVNVHVEEKTTFSRQGKARQPLCI